MSQPWLEDLSEEWVAQPAPEASGLESSTSLSTQIAHNVPPKPKSRLPRMRQSSASFSEIHLKHSSRELQPPKRRSALVERSLSDNNISQPASADDSVIAASRYASQSFSAASLDSVQFAGTVAQNPAVRPPNKDVPMHDTPEWRRRLLKGQIGYGDQKDLFSPMGLENIFAKPNDSSAEDSSPKRKLGLLKNLGTMPSSPPPWTSTQHEEGFSNEELQEEPDSMAQSQIRHRTGGNCNDSSQIRSDDFAGTSELGPQQGETRTVSGQIEFENENFSPVYLTTNLKVGPGTTPIPNFRGSELANRLRQLGTPPPSSSSQPKAGAISNNQSRENSFFARTQDDSLPEDLPAGTPDLADVGRFVEMRRGGYSRDGSFRRRPLSPSPQRLRPQSALRTETSAQLEANLTERTETVGGDGVQNLPKTPSRDANSKTQSTEPTKSSGSPLKLFDAHDTFTANRLHRRLSQLERKPEHTSSSNVESNKSQTAHFVQKTTLASVEETSTQGAITADVDNSQHSEQLQRAGTFGRGELNRYQFSGEFSMLSSQASEEQSAPDESPSIDVAPPGSRAPLKFHYDASPISREPSRARRQGLTRVQNPYRTFSHSRAQNGRQVSVAEQLALEPEVEYAEGKRGPTSPFKNPTPKRRRTTQSIFDDDDNFSDTGLQSTKDTHKAMQSIIGRKRKDARHDPSNNVADPEVLARRHILRPRNPTPSQRRLDELNAEIIEATEAFIESSPKMTTIREQIDRLDDLDAAAEESRAVSVAHEVAAFSMRRQQAMREDTRKRSVTTQDFLDEAVKIMDYIRAKGRPTSGLGSLEETEDELPVANDKNGYPSSSLTYDDPPSRDGRRSAWKEPNKRELDPQVMSHLRRFQEGSDDALGSSFHSLRISRMKAATYSDGESIIAEQDGIRITDNPHRHETSSQEQTNSQPRTSGTNPSSGSSMGQTAATSASRRSDHVATLAPEAVAHLIPEKINGMSFDRENNQWVRHKSPSKEHQHQEGISGTNESEDDPFGNIPDLTVDETAERLRSPIRPQATAETFLEETEAPPEEKSRPTTREGQGTAFTDTSSVPSKVSNFAWSFPKTETRATSLSDQGYRNSSTQKAQQAPTTSAIPESEEYSLEQNDVEHEIKYFEGRGTAQPSVLNSRIRDITISIAEHETNDVSHSSHPVRPSVVSQNHWSTIEHRRIPSPTKTPRSRARTLPKLRNQRESVSRVDGALPPREDLRPRNYHMQLSMSVAPLVTQQDALLLAPSSPVKGDVTFMLSDLPEFTLNQVDECELPDRVVIKHDGHRFSKALEDRYALGTAELLKALQDAVPDEPYWEDLRELNIQGKNLENLHRLDEFCFRLEELNVSDNGICQTQGIPYTLRRLRAENNCLTSLTSWAALTNLQYLDISGNDIDSLDGLSELIHLRTLKASDNKIKSLDGILRLDGLMELIAARNEIECVDFAKAELKSLTDLDLRGNLLCDVRNVHRLPQLQNLNLDENAIQEFPMYDMPAGKCKALRSLRLCGNGTTSLDVDDYFPKLESLYVDRNALTNVIGLEHLQYLRTFSAREQVLDSDSDAETCVGNLLRNPDVRNLHLSLNPARGLEISQHLLNLQRLELASMGLKELPDDFGQLTPNIRSVNLNFNSIRDLRPLLNIKRLSELCIAGNRLERLRANAMVLGKLGTVSKLDWRDNPLSLRFYAPASENRIMSLRQKPCDEQATDRFILPAGDADMDQQYLLRLDEETRIRRRVTEMMLANFCRNLRELDGLPFDKTRVLVKDDVWERLLYLGVIQRKQPDTPEHTDD